MPRSHADQPPWKKDPLNEPERAGRHHDDRTGKGELPPRGLAPRAQRRERRRHHRDDQQLADFHAGVEREQRPAERPRRQIHLAQHVREAEAMDEAERERNPGADVAAVADQQVVGADVDDAQRDGRLDQARRRADEVERGQRQRDAVRHGERRHDDDELPGRAAEQQQADEEQQVIRSDEDVTDAGRQEPPHDGEGALPRAGEILEVCCVPRRGSPASAHCPRRCSETSGAEDRTETSAPSP